MAQWQDKGERGKSLVSGVRERAVLSSSLRALDFHKAGDMLDFRQISIDAGAAGCYVAHVASHLFLCLDRADCEVSLQQLRRNRPEYFQPSEPTPKPKSQPKTEAPERAPLLDWQTINELVRDSGAIDRPCLSSYLRWCTSKQHAWKTIDTLRDTHAEIWIRKASPDITRQEHFSASAQTGTYQDKPRAASRFTPKHRKKYGL